MPAVSIASPFIGPVRKWATNSFGTDGSLATSRDTFFALLSIIRSFAFVMPRTQNYGQAPTDQQMRMYMEHRCHHPQRIAAAKSGVSERTGRRIESDPRLPSQK